MIRVARFRNFKSLRHVRLDLEPLTVIVGPNASGKTSILQALQSICSCGLDHPSLLYRGIDHPVFIRSAGASDPLSLAIEGAWENRPGEVQLSFSERTDEGGVTRWIYQIDGDWGGSGFGHSGGLDNRDTPTEAIQRLSEEYRSFVFSKGTLLRRLVAGTSFLRLDPVRLAQPSYSDRHNPVLEFDGTGLASVLAHVALTAPETFQSLQDAFKAIIPAVRRIRLDRAPVRRTERDSVTINGEAVSRPVDREYWGHRISLDMEGSPGTYSEAVSEGTLLVLGLLTALMAEGGRELVLLDDLERGLHPKAMGVLVRQLRSIQEKQPGLQIIATSHSPYLIDHFRPQEVRLTTTTPDGAVICGGLEQHPDFSRWRDAMLPGEFWSTVGEKWLTERESVADAVG